MVMMAAAHRTSLNPNAPMFVPVAYRTVEDFSDQWWALVQTTPWFREYWLQERFQDPENDPDFSEIDDLILSDLDDAFFEDYAPQREEERDYRKDLIPIGALKWPRGRGFTATTKYVEKAPKIVNVKVSPRTIQQPR